MPVNYDAVPEELRWTKQWLLAIKDEDGLYKAPGGVNKGKFYNADSSNPKAWLDFEIAVQDAEENPPCGIGFCLTEQDEYTVIDLDVKNKNNYPDNPELWTSQEDLDRFWVIVQAFDSYTERSRSGQGLHIWVKGSIGPGLKRDGVEVYSKERFMVTTGDVVIAKDIQPRQELLNSLVAEMRPYEESSVELIEIDPVEDDLAILERARAADNGEKFNMLMDATSCIGKGDKKVHGTYTELGYSSQSEADLALMSIFTFYSKSNAQCKRLFRRSALAQRAKATRDDVYLNYTLSRIRGRQANEEASQEHGAELAAQLIANLTQQHEQPASELVSAPVTTPMLGEVPINSGREGEVTWPPGYAGLIAWYIFQNSPRPVKEVSIVAALGLLAGICGKGYAIPQSGLNLYIVLVARSAIGKEAMHTGVSTVLSYCMETHPDIVKFVDFSDYASGPALTKAVAANSCFLNVSGEWGRKLKKLSDESGNDGPMQSLRTTMTNLYQKSGPRSIVGGIGYSDKEKNVASISGVAYSMIGESTPDTFYESLTQQMMADGFMSRFVIVEYDGDRPDANKRDHERLPEHMRVFLTEAARIARGNIESGSAMMVKANEKAEELLEAFNLECDTEVRKTKDEGWRQMWNRAHLKAYKLSALIAVSKNHSYPLIEEEDVVWSIDLIRRDIAIMQRRMNSGDVGIGDGPRESKVLALAAKFISEPVAASYNVPVDMHKAGIITRKYLQINTQKISAFTNHRNGSTAALDYTIKSLIDSGYFMEVPKEKAVKDYQFHGKCYRVINLPGHLVKR